MENKSAAVDAAETFVANQGRIKHRARLRTSLVFGGDYGVGKTVLATATYKAILWQLDHPEDTDPSLNATWAKWHSVISEVQSTYSPGAETDRARVLGKYQSADVLLLDDVGDLDKDMQSDDRRRILYEIIDVRNDWLRPTIITSNVVSISKLKKQFGERTFERLREMSAFYLMGGENLRDTDIDVHTQQPQTE
jgi:DNA replication protein DnaC